MKLKYASLATLIALSSCGKKSDDETATTTSGTDNVKTASSLIITVNTALASVPSSSFSLASKMSGNPYCTEHGQPLIDGVTTAKGATSTDSDRLSSSHKDYPSRFFLCLSSLSAADGASVETLQGSLAQVSSVMCTIEKALGSFEYTTAGTNLVANGNVTAALDSSCWPNGTPEGITSIIMDSGTATLLDASTGFEKELKFTSTAMGVSYKVHFFNKNGIMGFRTYDNGTSPGVGGYSEMTLDSGNGVILINTVDDRNGAGGADSAYRRVNRMVVKGDLDKTTLKFSKLTAMQGIRAESSNYATSPNSFGGVTINGDSTKGYYGTSVTYDGSAITSLYAGCTGAKADCTATGTGFTFTDGTFYSSRTDWETYKASAKPMCYDGKDITFAATPTTGSFGKCP